MNFADYNVFERHIQYILDIVIMDIVIYIGYSDIIEDTYMQTNTYYP